MGEKATFQQACQSRSTVNIEINNWRQLLTKSKATAGQKEGVVIKERMAALPVT